MKKKRSMVGWTCEEDIEKCLYWCRAKEVNEDLYLGHYGKLGDMVDMALDIFENKKDALKIAKKEDEYFYKDNVKKVRITIEEIK